MNKRAIGLIIGLMSAALIGIGWLQVTWIRSAIHLNEQNFDRAVHSALKKVADRVEYEDQLEMVSSINGYMANYYKEVQQTTNGGTLVTTIDLAIGQVTAAGVQTGEGEVCNCLNCREERINDFTNWLRYNQEMKARPPLAERVTPGQIDDFLEQELMDRGIQIDYNYGVFSNREESFIIVDDHYVVEENNPKEYLPGYQNLSASKYYVYLFPNEKDTPGLLMIHFPTKTSFLWQDVWKNLLGSIFFTGIILFCFAYTINVIFRQKKLSMMKTDFINNMTHEFKTPIASISLATSMLQRDKERLDERRQANYLRLIETESKRLEGQVDKVLQIAMIDSGNFSLDKKELDIHEIIERVVEGMNLIVNKRKGSIQLYLQASRSRVMADETHLVNIIYNLVDNALKYTLDIPEIIITTRDGADGLEVSIKDNGIGIGEEIQKYIFDKFYRAETGDVHNVKGFGLGLSYVKKIIEAHAGKIDLQSELNQGSEFRLYFPQS